MQKLRPKSPDGANSPSFYSSPPITTFDHTQMSLLPVPKFQPASGKPRPRAGVIKLYVFSFPICRSAWVAISTLGSVISIETVQRGTSIILAHSGTREREQG